MTNKITKQEFGEMLALLAAAYPNYQLTKETVQAYYHLLADIDRDALRAAALGCVAGNKFFPSVHEIRAAAGANAAEAAGIPHPMEAWAEVARAKPWAKIEITDDNEIIKYRWRWSHPLVERVALALGFPGFPGENVGVDRAHFLKMYSQALADWESEQFRLPAVANYIEAARAAGQLPEPEETDG